jgi:RNA polymerase sigma-70 factor (ECF subfamily)
MAWVVLNGEANDAELVRRCLDGDPEAYGALVAKYEKVVFNVAYRMVQDREDARDLAQGAFVKAYEKLRSYDPSSRFFSWIYRILVNDTLNLLERKKPDQPLDPAREPVSPGDAHEALEAREKKDAIGSALMWLSPESREVIVLKYFAGLSHGEMSLALKLPEKTVKSRLYSARQRLAELLYGSAPR